MLEVSADEFIIIQMRIGVVDAIDFCRLPRAKRLVGIKTPGSLQQALSAQDFVQTSDTSCELVSRVEERRVAVSNFDASTQQGSRNPPTI